MKQHPLNEIVKLNEGIKSIVQSAEEINLLALNAIIISKKMGDAVSGFRVVSSELRNLAETLTVSMHYLMEKGQSLVQLMSQQLRNNQTYAAFLQISQYDYACDFIKNTLSITSNTLESHKEQLDIVIKALQIGLSKAYRVCMFGSIISTSAKIEATYTDNQNKALANVSDSFAGKMTSILAIIKELDHSLKVLG